MAAAARRGCGFGLHGPRECAQEEEQGEADAVVCLAWPTTENIRENDSMAVSSGARPWQPREGTRREARRRAGSGEASLPGVPLLGVRRRARGREQGTRQQRRRAASMRGDHVGKRSNRWRAPVWLWWSAGLGQLRADLVHGPKTKFSVLGPLYIFH